jgi:hypothetical protein
MSHSGKHSIFYKKDTRKIGQFGWKGLEIRWDDIFKLTTVNEIVRHGASSGCGWRRRSPDMEGSCEYIE